MTATAHTEPSSPTPAPAPAGQNATGDIITQLSTEDRQNLAVGTVAAWREATSDLVVGMKSDVRVPYAELLDKASDAMLVSVRQWLRLATLVRNSAVDVVLAHLKLLIAETEYTLAKDRTGAPLLVLTRDACAACGWDPLCAQYVADDRVFIPTAAGTDGNDRGVRGLRLMLFDHDTLSMSSDRTYGYSGALARSPSAPDGKALSMREVSTALEGHFRASGRFTTIRTPR